MRSDNNIIQKRGCVEYCRHLGCSVFCCYNWHRYHNQQLCKLVLKLLKSIICNLIFFFITSCCKKSKVPYSVFLWRSAMLLAFTFYFQISMTSHPMMEYLHIIFFNDYYCWVVVIWSCCCICSYKWSNLYAQIVTFSFIFAKFMKARKVFTLNCYV
jgi:hypothetical protein